jgi:hypothetical protein
MKLDVVRLQNPEISYMINDVAYGVTGNVILYDQQLVNEYYESIQYQVNRKMEYPNIGDQLDMLWHAIDSGTLDKDSEFYTTLKAVKNKYPKSDE